ncbi:MAG: hypothetical protein ABSB40_09510 [Nitrososphaeria archaeon]|jgi:hypothetical protein
MKKRMLVTVLLVLLLLPVTVISTVPISTNTANASSFFVQTAFWGTSGQALRSNSTVQEGPGDLNVPLTVNVEYFGISPFSSPAASISATLNLPSGFTDTNGSNSAVAYSEDVTPNSVFQLTFMLNIDSNASLGWYTFPMDLKWNTTNPVIVGSEELISFPIQLKGDVTLSFNTSQVYLIPDQVNVVPIQLDNTGSGNASDISISAVVPAQTSLLNQFELIPTLNAHSSMLLNLSVYIPPSAGNTPMTFYLTANYENAYLISQTVSASLGFIVKSFSAPILKLTSSTSNLAPGSTTPVTFTLENDGQTVVGNISLELSAQSPITLLNTDGVFNIGTLNPNQNQEISVSVYVPIGATNAASISFTFSYLNPSGIAGSDSGYLSFLLSTTSTISPIVLNVKPTALVAGKVDNMTITLSNGGTTQINSVSMTFAFAGSSITWLQPALFQIAELAPGQSVNITGEAYASTSATASTQFTISTNYYDSNGVLNQIVRNFGILAQGLVDMEVVSSTILPTAPTVGSIFSATVTINNVGTISAASVTATPQLPQGLRIFGSTSVFIGTMPTDSPTTFTISVETTNTTKPGRYVLPVTLTYFDNLRNSLSTKITLNVDIVNQTSTVTFTRTPGTTSTGIGLFSITLLIVIAVVILGVGYYLVRKRKRKEEP